MAGVSFSTDHEKKKWDSLQHSAGNSIQNILQGKASNADYQRVTSVLNGLNQLAAKVFTEAVSAAESQVSRLQDAVDYIRDETIDSALSDFELALNEQLKPIVPTLLKEIQDIFRLELLQSNEDLEKSIGSKFEHLQDLLPPKDLPTTDDVLASNELVVEEIRKQDDLAWDKREKSLIEKIAETFKGTLRDLADQINREKAARARGAAGGSGFPALTGPSGGGGALQKYSNHDVIDVDAYESPIISQVGGLLGGPQMFGGAHSATTEQALAATSVGSGSLKPGREATQIQLSNKTEQAIAKAAENQTELYQKLFDFLNGTSGGGGGGAGGQTQGEMDEASKADIWWRSFKNAVGDSGKSSKSKKDDDESGWKKWLKTIGQGLSLALLAPNLFESFGKMIEKYVTWDNINKVFKEAWDDVVKEGETIVNWIVDKFSLGNIKDGLKNAGNYAKDKAEGAWSWAKDKLGMGGDKKDGTKPASTPASGGSSGGSSGGGSAPSLATGGEGTTGSTKAAPVAAAGSPTTYESKVNQQLGYSSGGNTVNNPVSVNSRSSLTGGNATNNFTFSAPAQGASMRPGVTTAVPGSAPVADSGAAPGAPARGTPQIGIASFGFNAGMDDSLLLANTNFLTS